jgi:glucose/arabinose dehydrogenase
VEPPPFTAHGTVSATPVTKSFAFHLIIRPEKRWGDYEDFVTGFVTPQDNVWGRPVGITVSKDGSLLFSEDGNDTIWRVSYGK